MSFSTIRKAFVVFCLAPTLGFADTTGVYNCFLNYQWTPNPEPQNGDLYCINAMFSIDFDRKRVSGIDRCVRLQNNWVHESLISRDLIFTASPNEPINGVTRIAITEDRKIYYFNLMPVNAGNSMFVQGDLFGGSGVCHRP